MLMLYLLKYKITVALKKFLFLDQELKKSIQS